MPRPQALTLFSALLLGLSIASLGVAAVDAPRPTLARRGGEHARMIRRYGSPIHHHGRAPAPGIFDGLFGDDEEAAVETTTTATETTTRGGILDGIGDVLGGGETTTSSSTPTPTPTSTTTTTRTVVRTPTTTTTQPPPTSTKTTSVQAPVTKFVYEDLTPEQKEVVDENRKHQSTLSRIPENVRTGLIIAGSVLAGLMIIWTAVRKWKLRSSSSFQRRLAPIEWQPEDKDSPAAVPMMAENDDRGSIRRDMFAPDAPSSLAPPAHDFTAVPGGYRSASPASGFRSTSPGPGLAYRTASPMPYGRTPSPAPGQQGGPYAGY